MQWLCFEWWGAGVTDLNPFVRQLDPGQAFTCITTFDKGDAGFWARGDSCRQLFDGFEEMQPANEKV